MELFTHGINGLPLIVHQLKPFWKRMRHQNSQLLQKLPDSRPPQRTSTGPGAMNTADTTINLTTEAVSGMTVKQALVALRRRREVEGMARVRVSAVESLTCWTAQEASRESISFNWTQFKTCRSGRGPSFESHLAYFSTLVGLRY